MNLTSELDDLKKGIKKYAESCGLDFFDVVFELCTYDQINQIAALGGFPTRYPHWRFGMEYEKLSKSYTWGLSKIYEMVINNDPCYAYLMNCNPMVDQKLVMAHVYAHSDFFKNNCFFAHTTRKAIDEMANHGARIRSYSERHGHEKVEDFLDCCLSIENLIDVHSTGIRRRVDDNKNTRLMEDKESEAVKIERIRAKDYMDRFVNPKEFLDFKKKEIEEEQKKEKRIPPEPERDVLHFLLEYAPLEKWQRDVLSIVREEAYYFAPQWMTKIMNEGWATYWHSKMMTEKLCTDAEVIDFADHHSGTVAQAPGQMNPYKVGVELFRNIEERWDKGQHGLAYDACTDYHERKNWDTHAMEGREKIFEIRTFHNDVTFIDAFLTPDFVDEHKLYQYQYNRKAGRYEIVSRDFDLIKRQFLSSLTNGGQPFIYVIDGNFGNRGELYLQHRYDGVELKLDFCRATLRNLQKVWSRPVHIQSVFENKTKRISFDGKEFKDVEVSSDEGDEHLLVQM